VEAVSAVIDTGELSGGRHMLFVQGTDAAGNTGAVSAVFFDVESEWAFEKSVRENIVAPGGQLHYELSLSLEGTDAEDAYTVTLTDTLPAGVSVDASTILVNGDPRPDLYNPTTRTIRYEDAGTFDDTLDLRIQFTAVVNESAASGQWITNQASAEVTLNGEPLLLPVRTADALVLRNAVQFYLPLVLSP
jgi:fimbrial isopeptide formation D2 family protein